MIQSRLQILGQSDKATVIKRHEPALGAIKPVEQIAHIQNLLIVQGDLTIQAEPIAALRNPQAEFGRRNR